jgi:hypothetical protein
MFQSADCGKVLTSAMATGKCFTDLPDEVLLKIFSNLNIEDLAMSVHHVNSHWKNVSQDGSLWKNKTFSPEYKMSDEEIAGHLINMPALQAFSLSRGTNTKITVDTLCKYCRDIRHLQLHRLSNSELLYILKNIPNLETLAVCVPDQMDQLYFADLVGQFQKLKKLSFIEAGRYTDGNGILRTICSTIADGVLRAIADGCPSLHSLYIGHGCKFQNQDIEYFLQTKGQQLLSFSFRICISFAAHRLLTECVNLEYLQYEHYQFDQSITYLQLLSKLSKLRNLTLVGCREGKTRTVSNIFKNQSLSKLITLHMYYCDDLDGTSLAVILTNCPQLQSFTLRESEFTDCGFQYIGICKNLQFLDIGFSFFITDKSMEYVGAGCPNLNHLDIGVCPQLTDKSVEYVCTGCPKLKFLAIQECPKMTDDVIKHICKSKKLNVLRLAWNAHLLGTHFLLIPSNLVHLTELDVHSCLSLDKNRMDKLKEEMPHLNIILNYAHSKQT